MSADERRQTRATGPRRVPDTRATVHRPTRASGGRTDARPSDPGSWPTRTWRCSSRCRTRSSASSTWPRGSSGATAPPPPSSATSEDGAGPDVARRPHPPDDLVEALALFDQPTGDTEPAGDRVPVPVQGRQLALVGVDGPLERRSPGWSTAPPATSPTTTSPRAALRANEAWLAAILDHSTAAIFVKDRTQRYVRGQRGVPRGPSGSTARTSWERPSAEIWPEAPDRRHRPAGARPTVRSSPGTTSWSSATAPTS